MTKISVAWLFIVAFVTYAHAQTDFEKSLSETLNKTRPWDVILTEGDMIYCGDIELNTFMTDGTELFFHSL